jgi:cytochrome c-type biogenesis protein CcmH
MKKFISAFIFMLLLGGMFTKAAFAQQPTPSDDEVNKVASQLYCPVCESTPLDVCPTEACRQWRDLIRQQLADGMTTNQIKQYFVDNYGGRVLAEPPKVGFNWIVYILPPIIILAGAIMLFRSFRVWTKPQTASAESDEAQSEPSKDDYMARFEEEVKKRN